MSIPGLRGREPKEITLKNLSKIIHARVVEIVEQAYLEIKNYGHEETKKKLIAGIVLTGGGAELKHIKQLVEYITGMDTRIGYPNEHISGSSDIDMSSPSFATAVGLLMKGLNQKSKDTQKQTASETEKATKEFQTSSKDIGDKKSIFEKWADKFREFLDNAE